MFPPQQNFPLCTIAETPRLPEHCVEYALVVLWQHEFGEDQQTSPATSDSSNGKTTSDSLKKPLTPDIDSNDTNLSMWKRDSQVTAKEMQAEIDSLTAIIKQKAPAGAVILGIVVLPP